MSNYFENAFGAIILEDSDDFSKVEKFCKDNDIYYTTIGDQMLKEMGCCPNCGDSEFWNFHDQHCNHCG